MTNPESTDKQLHDKQHTLLQDKITDKEDDKHPLLLLDLVTNMIQLLILFLHNLFNRLRLKIE
jgi:hypothetical protein